MLCLKVFLNDRQPRAYSIDVLLHLMSGRRIARKLSFFLIYDTGTLISEANRVPFIEYRDDHFSEFSMDEIL